MVYFTKKNENKTDDLGVTSFQETSIWIDMGQWLVVMRTWAHAGTLGALQGARINASKSRTPNTSGLSAGPVMQLQARSAHEPSVPSSYQCSFDFSLWDLGVTVVHILGLSVDSGYYRHQEVVSGTPGPYEAFQANPKLTASPEGLSNGLLPLLTAHLVTAIFNFLDLFGLYSWMQSQ
jgi:hypothetical protein